MIRLLDIEIFLTAVYFCSRIYIERGRCPADSSLIPRIRPNPADKLSNLRGSALPPRNYLCRVKLTKNFVRGDTRVKYGAIRPPFQPREIRVGRVITPLRIYNARGEGFSLSLSLPFRFLFPRFSLFFAETPCPLVFAFANLRRVVETFSSRKRDSGWIVRMAAVGQPLENKSTRARVS